MMETKRTSSNKNLTVQEYFDDNVSDLGSICSDFHSPTKLTAPYFERVPVFSDPVASSVPNGRAELHSATNSPRKSMVGRLTPKRPNSSRPNTSSRGGTTSPSSKHRPQNTNSLESRIMMKIASFMPDDVAAQKENNMYNRLSMSRTDLIQLNTVLDEMMAEVREAEAAMQSGNAIFSAGNGGTARDAEDVAVAAGGSSTLEFLESAYAYRNGEIMYDTIFSDLIGQAVRKTQRVRKHHRNRAKVAEDAARTQQQRLEVRIEELTSALHAAEAERLLYLQATEKVKGSGWNAVRALTVPAQPKVPSTELDHGMPATGETTATATATAVTGGEVSGGTYRSAVQAAMGPVSGDTASDEAAAASRQAVMAQALAGILQTERKDSIARMTTLSAELVAAQEDLQGAHSTILELKQQLLERDRLVLDLSRLAVQQAVSRVDNGSSNSSSSSSSSGTETFTDAAPIGGSGGSGSAHSPDSER